ncbi:MAG: T9SS type A sorting domain-containing protein, partial [Hymenobacter sp.]
MSVLSLYLPKSPLAKLPCWIGARWRPLLLWLWLGLLSVAAHAQRPILRLDLLTSGPGFDQTYVYFEQGATTGYDPDFDAAKLVNPSGLNLASFAAGSQQMAINGLPPAALNAPFTVDLFVGVPAYGSYTMQVGQFDSFAAVATVYLTDALLDTTVSLALGTTYAFDLTAANNPGISATSTRFALLFLPVAGPLRRRCKAGERDGQGPGVRVRWATASEQHSAYFGIERSPDGLVFGEIGRVAAAGTSARARTYEFLDQQPLVGVAYYRLRQVDQDGSWQYSPVQLAVWQPALAALRAFPNPAHGATTVLGATPGERVAVLDTQGRVVAAALAGATGTATLRLPTGLASGVYIVRAGTQAARLVV